MHQKDAWGYSCTGSTTLARTARAQSACTWLQNIIFGSRCSTLCRVLLDGLTKETSQALLQAKWIATKMVRYMFLHCTWSQRVVRKTQIVWYDLNIHKINARNYPSLLDSKLFQFDQHRNSQIAGNVKGTDNTNLINCDLAGSCVDWFMHSWLTGEILLGETTCQKTSNPGFSLIESTCQECSAGKSKSLQESVCYTWVSKTQGTGHSPARSLFFSLTRAEHRYLSFASSVYAGARGQGCGRALRLRTWLHAIRKLGAGQCTPPIKHASRWLRRLSILN